MSDREKTESQKTHKMTADHVLHTLIWTMAIPLSMSFWIMNLIYSRIFSSEGYDEPVVIHPIRWLAACMISIIIVMYSYRSKKLNCSGAVTAFFVGFFLTLSSFCFLAILFVFFMSSSKATKFRTEQKKKLEVDYKEGGQRNWVQVLCNGGMATQLAILYLLDVGSSERAIDFVKDYRASWLSIGILGALASCNGDTWASELGTVLSNSQPYLITSFRRVPKGTNGGVSLAGTFVSCLGGLALGLTHYLVILYYVDSTALVHYPPQWPLILIGAMAGFLGSLIDSFLGATLQYSGMDKSGRIVSHPSEAVKYISGRSILDNHSVNLLSSILTSLLLPTISNFLWPLLG